MRVVLGILFVVGCLITLVAGGITLREGSFGTDSHAEVSTLPTLVAALIATAGLILVAVCAAGLSALTKLAVIRDALTRAQATGTGDNAYSTLPTYYDPTRKG